MYYKNSVIIKKEEKDGLSTRKTSNANYDYLNGFEKYKMKDRKIEEGKQKPLREILDNYRYLEIICIKIGNERSRSIVKHIRWGKPIGKETEYKREKYNYYSKSPVLRQINKERKYYNQNENRKATTIYSDNSSNNYKNSIYQVKELYQKSNIYSNKNKENLSVVSKIDLSTINIQEKYPINKNQQKYSFNKKKSNINTTQKEQLSQNNFEYPNNKYIIKENYSNQSPKKQINQLNQRFKSPEPKQRIKKVDDYKYQPLSANSEICQICGKPKRPRGIHSNAKSNKSIKREIIAEETSTNSYVIRYSTENENQNKPYFQTFRAPGTRFCPVHGYV